MVVSGMLLAHLIGDFLLQSEYMTKEKLKLHVMAVHLLLHSVLIAVPLTVFYFLDGNVTWKNVLNTGGAIIFTHGLLDYMKAWLPVWCRKLNKSGKFNRKEIIKWSPIVLTNGKFIMFILDQILHVLAILMCSWAFLDFPLPNTMNLLLIKLHILDGGNFVLQPANRFLLLCIMLIIVTSFCGRLIQLVAEMPVIKEMVEEKVTIEKIESDSNKSGKPSKESESKYKKELSFSRANETGLSHGRQIGYFERIIVMILAFKVQYPAIVFIITAKSLFRFKQLDHREWAEYFLVGTLASVMLGITCGHLLRLFW